MSLLDDLSYNKAKELIVAAMQRKDKDWLNENARCGCCCDEHYSTGCYAQLWGGCRGQQPELMLMVR